MSSHLVHKQGHYRNRAYIILGKKVWDRVITPLWCLKAPSPATKKWIFEFCTKFGFRNHLQTFWPRWLVKSELSLGPQSFARKHQSRRGSYFEPQALYFSLRTSLSVDTRPICSSRSHKHNL